jgi:hypothetical protein
MLVNAIQRTKKAKRKHILARVRDVLDCSQKSAPEYLGISTDTCAGVESGRLRFTHALAERVSMATGLTVECLTGNASAPLVMVNGEQFTRENYDRYQMAQEKFMAALPDARKKGDECFRYFLLLCIKLGRVMLAGADAKDAKFAAWKLRDELAKVGRRYPAFAGTTDAAGKLTPSKPEAFDFGLQTQLNTGTPPEQLWDSIRDQFHQQLRSIEAKHANAATSKPAKPAKPARR